MISREQCRDVKLSPEQFEIIHSVIKKICGKYARTLRLSPAYSMDDIYQAMWIDAIKGMTKYDEQRPLKPFMTSHIQKRILNFFRDEFKITKSPCEDCQNGSPCWEVEPGETQCERYKKWAGAKQRHNRVHFPSHNLDVPVAARPDTDAILAEDREETLSLLTKVVLVLPEELRATYLRMMRGDVVPKKQRDEVINHARKVFSQEEFKQSRKELHSEE